MRFFFEIAYNGSAYHGWQKQKNAISLQEVISQKIQQFFNDPKLEIVGCGRTDAGVHARQFFFHIDLNKSVKIRSKSGTFPFWTKLAPI